MKEETKTKNEDPINYRQIKRWLSKKDITELSEEFGFVPGHVYNIVGGRANNIWVLQKAIDRAVANKMRAVESVKKLVNLDD